LLAGAGGGYSSHISQPYAHYLAMETVTTSSISSFMVHLEFTDRKRMLNAKVRFDVSSMRRTERRRPRPGSIHTTRLHQARAAPCQGDMETKPFWAHHSFFPLYPTQQSHLQRDIDGWRASSLSPSWPDQMARDNVRQRQDARVRYEGAQVEKPVTPLWTRYQTQGSGKLLAVPASLPRHNAGRRCCAPRSS